MTNGARRWRACEELGLTIRTVQRWKKGDSEEVKVDARKGAQRAAPANKLSETERAEILQIVNSEAYSDKPPSQIVPALADKGVYMASESTIYRILREASQLRHRGRSAVPQKHDVSGHYATGPNQVWSWDITWLPGPVKGLFLYLYLILDVFSRKVVGWEIYDRESMEYSSEVVLRATLSERLQGKPLVLHSDNGSPMKGSSLLTTLSKLGIEPSFSRPGVSNDNPYSESLFRTLKYRPVYPYKGFADIEAARKWVYEFVIWYNKEHRHSGLNFITPDERHEGAGLEVMKRRRVVYEAARAKHPERWTKGIRNFKLPDVVWLNPPSKADVKKQKKL